MISELEELNKQEYRLLYDAPLLVSILIAGADNNIDKKEIDRAAVLLNNRPRKCLDYRTPHEVLWSG